MCRSIDVNWPNADTECIACRVHAGKEERPATTTLRTGSATARLPTATRSLTHSLAHSLTHPLDPLTHGHRSAPPTTTTLLNHPAIHAKSDTSKQYITHAQQQPCQRRNIDAMMPTATSQLILPSIGVAALLRRLHFRLSLSLYLSLSHTHTISHHSISISSSSSSSLPSSDRPPQYFPSALDSPHHASLSA